MVLGPAWTRGEIEAPAGTKEMGGWTAAVYTAEQQARLGVDESGKKLQENAAPAPQPGVQKIVGLVGPAWTRGEVEAPAGTKDMGGWTSAVYTAEQQARLGVDEQGKKVQAASAGVLPTQSVGAVLQALPPPWLTGQMERPAGTEVVGTATFLVFTPEQQARLGVDKHGKATTQLQPQPVVQSTVLTQPMLTQALPPPWLTGQQERPAGTEVQGTATFVVFTPEQQARLGVDKFGKPTQPQPQPTVLTQPRALQALPPQWLSGQAERPAGTEVRGTATFLVYTPEQQARLGVDKSGKAQPRIVQGGLPPPWLSGQMERPAGTEVRGTATFAVFTPEQQARLGVDKYGKAAAQQQPITPAFAAALLGSKTLLHSMVRTQFHRFDLNHNQKLELNELSELAAELYRSLGLPAESMDKEQLQQSVAEHSPSAGQEGMTLEEFGPWFSALLQESLKKAQSTQRSESSSSVLRLTVGTMSGKKETVEVPSFCRIIDLRDAAADALNTPPAQTQLLLGTTILQPPRQTLSDFGLANGAELTAVILSSMKVWRHVYNAQGGSPEYRGYYLVASDEVELDPHKPLKEQWEQLVPADGYPGEGKPAPGQFPVLGFQPDGEAPRKWEANLNEVPVDLEETPMKFFGADGSVEYAVLLPMRGMD